VRNKVFYGRAVDDRDARLGPLEREGPEARPFAPAHYAHLHTEIFVLDRFNSTDKGRNRIAMSRDSYRTLEVVKGKVRCLPDKDEPVEHCRLCIHAREFKVGRKFLKSPSLAYCLACRVTEDVDVKSAEAVRCADRQGEGFHNIAGIIS
jgi:hypothetical protein